MFIEQHMEQLIRQKTFDKNNFTQKPLAKGEYEFCVFNNCDFSGADLSDVKFFECEFVSCNLSNAKLAKTIFRDIKFRDCKMLGLSFENCNPFGFSIQADNCSLNHSSFYQTKLKKTTFRNTSFHEADFTDCDLSNSVLITVIWLWQNLKYQPRKKQTSALLSITPLIRIKTG